MSLSSPSAAGRAATTSDVVPRPEARRMLIGIFRSAGKIPPTLLAAHTLRLHAVDPWPVVRAAAEALVRRATLARGEGLRVHKRPRGGEVFGEYTTRRPERGALLPYAPRLLSFAPLRVSCGCEDYRRNGLGLCAHGLAVLADVFSRPRARKRAELGREDLSVRLDWDPVRPLLGIDEPWSRLRFRAAGRAEFARDWDEGRRDPATGCLLGPGWLRPPHSSCAKSVVKAAARYAQRCPDRVSPAAKAVVEEELGRYAGEAPTPHAVERSLQSLKLELYPYQRQGVLTACSQARLLLADDMGLGKTAQAIGTAHALSELSRVRRGLVVVPAALQGQWMREWGAFTDVPLTTVLGRPSERRALYRDTTDGFLLISYAKLRRDQTALAEWAPDLVILDEAQRIKNADTMTARAVKALRPPYRLALTGTPLENRLTELASIVEWVDEGALEPKWRLDPVHGGPGQARHLSTIRARIAHCFLRRRRAEVLSQLPTRTDSSTPVPLTAEQAGPHESAGRKVARLSRLAKQRPLSPAERLELLKHLTTQRMAANGVAQLRFEETWPAIVDHRWDEVDPAMLAAPKLEALREVVEQLVITQGRTIVVFSQWRRMLRLAWWATRDLLEREGLRSVFFTGGESPRARDRSLVELHDDPLTRVLFATDAGGVGLNLQRAANACVHLELPWNPAVLEQRVARIHRLGQADPIDVVQLVTQGSIEARIEGLVAAKRSLFEGLFDSDADSVSMDDRALLERLGSPDDRDAGWDAEPASTDLIDGPALEDETPFADPVAKTQASSANPVNGVGPCGGATCGAASVLHTGSAPRSATSTTPGKDVAASLTCLSGPGVSAPHIQTPIAVSQMLTSLEVRAEEGGQLIISASPEAAEGLAALFRGMAALVAGSSVR
ncbi:MAG: DEAD/DEAH box helicase [Sandaracinaceae bacterium]